MKQQPNASGKPPSIETGNAGADPATGEAGQVAVAELSGEELNDRKRERIEEIKAAEKSFLELLDFFAPNGKPSRELNLAKTKIEEAAMWAIRGIVAL